MSLQDDFKARFPNFDETTIDTYWTALEASYPCYYGLQYGASACINEAILNLIAHLFVVETAESTASIKDIASQAVGSVSVSFSAGGTQTDQTVFFNSTKYGQKFLMLTKKRVGGFAV